MPQKLRIVFMGTPEFAVGILDAILQTQHEVVGVITAPDKPAGRGQKVKFSAVKEFALEKGLTLLQPTNLKEESFLSELRALEANLQVVVAFRMLPQVVWQMPALGTFNLHASLLPEYRGAAPINWAIINGETRTGVTTFFIDEQIDTGAMILQKELAIGDAESAGELHDRLMVLGQTAVVETLDRIASQTVSTTIQPQSALLKTAYKLNKDNCKINWDAPAAQVLNLIRGLSPYPAAWCFFEDQGVSSNVKVYQAVPTDEKAAVVPGTVRATKKQIFVAAKDFWVEISHLQFPGKKSMSAAELLNGMGFSDTAKAL